MAVYDKLSGGPNTALGKGRISEWQQWDMVKKRKEVIKTMIADICCYLEVIMMSYFSRMLLWFSGQKPQNLQSWNNNEELDLSITYPISHEWCRK